jgi:hypothetical protein
MEIFMTKEELARLMKLMDVNHDDSVDEKDFMVVMTAPSSATTNKAVRVREAAATLRLWLQPGYSSGGGNTDAAAANLGNLAPMSITPVQWKYFEEFHEKSAGARFPGFVSSDNIQLLLSNMGVHLSDIEYREVALLVAPEKNARIQEVDFNLFMTSRCRTAGELASIVQRTVLKKLIELYKAHRQAFHADGAEDKLKAEAYQAEVTAMVQNVQRVQQSSIPITNLSNNNGQAVEEPKHDIVSISQLKIGIESVQKYDYF